MKLGVIIDGISRDLAHALAVMDEFNLDHAELQYVWDKEIGDHDPQEIRAMRDLLTAHGKQVSCLSRHVLAGTTVANRPNDSLHSKHMEALKRVIDAAHALGSPRVRIMSPKKETILWGGGGAEEWNVAKGAWEAALALVAPTVELAKSEGIQLVTETGNGTMVNSCYTGRKLIDDLDALDTLKLLWDPANCCWCHETAYPDGYRQTRGGYLGHVHMKDVRVDTPRATLTNHRLGEGQLGGQFQSIADALREDGYGGVVSFESVYRPPGGNFEAGFRECIDEFRRIFG